MQEKLITFLLHMKKLMKHSLQQAACILDNAFMLSYGKLLSQRKFFILLILLKCIYLFSLNFRYCLYIFYTAYH